MLQISDYTLVHRLCLARRVGRQEEQRDILQTLHFLMSRAVVYDQRALSFLSLTCSVEFLDPVSEDLTRHPGFLVGTILCGKRPDILKAPGFGRLVKDQQRTLVCTGHVCTDKPGYSFFTLFPTVTVDVLEFERFVWHTSEEDTRLVGVVNVVWGVFFHKHGQRPMPLIHLVTFSVHGLFFTADALKRNVMAFLKGLKPAV